MIISCPLCQFKFDDEAENCHSGCPLSKKCNLLKCPNCNYEFVQKSSVVSFFKKFSDKDK